MTISSFHKPRSERQGKDGDREIDVGISDVAVDVVVVDY